MTFIAPFIDDGSKTGPPATYEYKIWVNEWKKLWRASEWFLFYNVTG